VNACTTSIEGLLVVEPTIYNDKRGFFLESWNQKKFNKMVKQDVVFVQDNHSYSSKKVLRGLHYQLKNTQGKLVRVVRGSVLDVVVDLRLSSASFGKYFSIELSSKNKKQLWIPAGFAHGFVTLSENVDFLYKTTDYYSSNDEISIDYNDKDLNIDWHLGESRPEISKKDQNAVPFRMAKYFQ
jgi:dTDP-4-dehydrorhamnose 3,5-epimerase